MIESGALTMRYLNESPACASYVSRASVGHMLNLVTLKRGLYYARGIYSNISVCLYAIARPIIS